MCRAGVCRVPSRSTGTSKFVSFKRRAAADTAVVLRSGRGGFQCVIRSLRHLGKPNKWPDAVLEERAGHRLYYTSTQCSRDRRRQLRQKGASELERYIIGRLFGGPRILIHEARRREFSRPVQPNLFFSHSSIYMEPIPSESGWWWE